MDGNHHKRRSWTAKYIPSTSNVRLSISSSTDQAIIPSVPASEPSHISPTPSFPSTSPTPKPEASRSCTLDSLPGIPTNKKHTSTPTPPPDHDQILDRTSLAALSSPTMKSPEIISRTSSGSFTKSFSSMMGGFSSLSLSRPSTREGTSSPTIYPDDKEARGRSMYKMKHVKSASQAPPDDDASSRSRSRARSLSPFSFRRLHNRDPSPAPLPIPLAHSDADLSDSAPSVHPHSTAFNDDSGDEATGDETEDEDWSDDDFLDLVTERNTEHNAIISPVQPEGSFSGGDADIDVDPDPLGEGVNVVVPPEPYFPSTLNPSRTHRERKSTRRRKSVKHNEPLPLKTSRPLFQRDRCTITLTQGDPIGKLGDRRKRRYIVASDLSEQSRFAMEWAIGTVLRDGDELLIVTVTENEAKVDPPIPSAADRTTKLRSQQERQGLAYILVRQATSLLQRTKLNVIVSCQAWHAKNSRHMLLDIADYNEPTMFILGSRGLGQLKGILLGSTSHYLIQKCSVPVMVARRRLKRPPRRSAHLSTHRTHVSLAEADIDRVVRKVVEDVQVMRDEITRDSQRRSGDSANGRDRDSGVAMEDEDGDEDDDDGN